jgi:hypothetical protein
MVVDLAIPDVAVELGSSARKLLSGEGGTAICRRAEDDPARRAAAGELLDALGIWDLDPREDAEQAMAAAEVVRAAGAVVLRFPVVGRLLAQDSRWVSVAPNCRGVLRVEHGDVGGSWLVAGLDGTACVASGLTGPSGTKLAPFLSRGEPGEAAPAVARADVALWLTLDSVWLLGAAEAALQLTVGHLLTRHQFGRPLASFQGVRLRVAECVTLLEGLRTLGQFTVWHRFEEPADALVDALALRSVALEAVTVAFWAAHQFHGAVGFSVEHDVSLLHRHVQGHLRLPADHDELGRLLLHEVERGGFASLYGRFQAGPAAESAR